MNLTCVLITTDTWVIQVLSAVIGDLPTPCLYNLSKPALRHLPGSDSKWALVGQSPFEL